MSGLFANPKPENRRARARRSNSYQYHARQDAIQRVLEFPITCMETEILSIIDFFCDLLIPTTVTTVIY